MITLIRNDWNESAKKATGDYLLFLKPTDRPDEKALHALEPFLKWKQPPWLYGRIELCTKQGEKIRFPYAPYKWWQLRREESVPLSATLISRSFFDKTKGFRTAISDYEMTLQLAKLAPPLALPTILTQIEEQTLTYHEKLHRIENLRNIRRLHFRSPIERWLIERTYRRQRQRIQLNIT